MDLSRQTTQAVEDPRVHKTVRALARLGYLAKGVLYGVVAVLALELAIGRGGAAVGPGQSVVVLGELPLGGLWLVLLSVGLFGLAVWRFVQALGDVEDRGTEAKAWLIRAGLGLSGCVYVGLLYAALRWLLTDHHPKRTPTSVEWTAKVMQSGWGRALVIAVGVVVAIYGIRAVVRAVNGSSHKRMMAEAHQRWVRTVCRFGVAARGVVFIGIGALVCEAAIGFDPDKAAGVGAALGTLARQPYGSVLIGIAGLGLLAYAFHSFVEARYRRIPV
jgi:hypothetical protein